MKVKVCGMRQQGNIEELIELQPNFIGFIFSEKSPRFVGSELDPEFVKSIPNTIKKVGVLLMRVRVIFWIPLKNMTCNMHSCMAMNCRICVAAFVRKV